MKCPRCGQDTYVIETRTKNTAVARKRACGTRNSDEDGCGYKFATAEVPVGHEFQFTVKMTAAGFKSYMTPKPPPLETPDDE